MPSTNREVKWYVRELKRKWLSEQDPLVQLAALSDPEEEDDDEDDEIELSVSWAAAALACAVGFALIVASLMYSWS